MPFRPAGVREGSASGNLKAELLATQVAAAIKAI